MKTKQLTLAFLCFLILTTKNLVAQKGNNQLSVIAEAGIPNNKSDIGFGVFFKGMYGIGKNAQVSLQIGASSFKSDDPKFTDADGQLVGADKTNLHLIPFLIGYKYNILNFYVEPQVGYGELGGRMDLGGDWSRPSLGAYYWAAGIGYQLHKIDVGVRYQSAYAPGQPDSGIWKEKHFSFTGIHIGYSFKY